jgi:hypothetical protein
VVIILRFVELDVVDAFELDEALALLLLEETAFLFG